MIWKICFAMSLIFLAAGAVMFFYKRYHGKGGVRYLGGGVFLSAVSICFPVMHLTEGWICTGDEHFTEHQNVCD